MLEQSVGKINVEPLSQPDVWGHILPMVRTPNVVMFPEHTSGEWRNMYAFAALKVAHHAYVLETGSIVLQGTGEELLKDERVIKAYLGG